jgi:hypothetical protein
LAITSPWKESKIITMPILGKDPKFLQNLHVISLSSTTGIVIEKIIKKIVQWHIDE